MNRTLLSCFLAAQFVGIPSTFSQIRDPERFAYDAEGRLTLVRDPSGNVTNFEYDAFGNVTKIAIPREGWKSQYAYDSRDALVSATDPKYLSTTYQINSLGGVTTSRNPDRGLAKRTFDNAGYLVRHEDAREIVAAFKYDLLGRLLRIDPAWGEPVEFIYDGVKGAVGKLSGFKDESGETKFAYDDFGRLVARSQTFLVAPRITLATSYVYLENGNVSSMSYPSGIELHFDYGDNGTLSRISLHIAGKKAPVVSNVEYESFGQLTGWQWGNGESPNSSVRRNFDLAGRVIGHTSGPSGGEYRSIEYDSNDLITSLSSGANAAKGNHQFEYDGLGRLTSNLAYNVVRRYIYDLNGNRISHQIGGRQYPSVLDGKSNRLLLTSGPLIRKNVYDSQGNLLSDGTRSFLYNAFGRMSSSSHQGVNVRYAYNAMGQRAVKRSNSRQIPSGTTLFIYDEQGRLIGEYDAQGTPIQETIFLGGLPVAIVKPEVTGSGKIFRVFYIYADHLGTPRKVVSAQDERTVWEWDSDPFGDGQPSVQSVAGQPFVYNYRFPGQYFDAETGLHYNYYRDYDPQVGRYVQSDPMGLMAGMNTYSYVQANPITLADPSGLLSYPAHIGITSRASRTFGVRYAWLAEMVANADFLPGSQDPANAFTHAMRDGAHRQSPFTAQLKYREFVKNQLESCTREGLARALHAIQDGVAAGHKGFQPWDGGSPVLGLPSSDHIWSDFFPSRRVREEAEAATRQTIRKFIDDCACKLN